ncbi:hypothetical protein AB0395_09070 [Streptosporangium sp. NPDC051023]|uniref:hypothetical protein n=1 Tax=Streptosporangium sp. NPDC051023 TaxID=3155410 RepID=UPI003450B258
MDAEDITRFNELTLVANERDALDVSDLLEVGQLLGEVTRAAAALADHANAEVTTLLDRYILHDDTGEEPQARLAEARHRLTKMASLLQDVSKNADRYYAAMGHIGVQTVLEADENRP